MQNLLPPAEKETALGWNKYTLPLPQRRGDPEFFITPSV